MAGRRLEIADPITVVRLVSCESLSGILSAELSEPLTRSLVGIGRYRGDLRTKTTFA